MAWVVRAPRRRLLSPCTAPVASAASQRMPQMFSFAACCCNAGGSRATPPRPWTQITLTKYCEDPLEPSGAGASQRLFLGQFCGNADQAKLALMHLSTTMPLNGFVVQGLVHCASSQ
eukprot:2230758-Amphidinium_carterae.1